MNRHEIVNRFIYDPEYKNMCKQIANEDADDLYQEIVLILLEMPYEKVEAINDTCMKCFFYVVASRQYNSVTSPFHKKYRKEAQFIQKHGADILQLMQSTAPDDDLMQKIDRAIKDVQWYDSGILSLYAEHGTLQRVSDMVGIPLKSIHHTVSNTRKLIRKKIKKYD
jgi:DNA-directed RNA polymerase specialized sigma24 family protein